METVYVPLAERLRPKILKDLIGQEHLAGTTGLLTQLAKNKQPANLILWGPPGTGKTTIARILCDVWDVEFILLSCQL